MFLAVLQLPGAVAAGDVDVRSIEAPGESSDDLVTLVDSIAADGQPLARLCSTDLVQRIIAAGRPEDAAPREQEQLATQRRLRLRARLRDVALHHALDVEQGLLPYLALDPRPDYEPPRLHECSSVDPGAEADRDRLRHREAELSSLHQLLLQAGPETLAGVDGGLLASILAQTYEWQLLHRVLGTGAWHATASAPLPAAPPGGAFPLSVVLRPALGTRGSSEARQRLILHHVPLLARPAHQLLDVPTSAVADALFAAAFLPAATGSSPEEITAAVVADALPDLARRWEQLDGRTAEELRATLAPVARVGLDGWSGEQLRLLAAWDHFLTAGLSPLIEERVERALLVPGTVERLREELLDAAQRWQRELRTATADICEQDGSFVEAHPELMHLYLFHHLDREALALLDGYCSTRWGQTPRRLLESLATTGSLLSFVAAFLFPAASPYLVAAGNALLAGHFASQTTRKLDALHIESALFNPELARRHQKLGEMALSAALVPTSPLLSAAGARTILSEGGARFFLPGGPRSTLARQIFWISFVNGQAVSAWKFWQEGKNPLRTWAFWDTMAIYYVSSLTFSRIADATGLAAFAGRFLFNHGMIAATNHYVQHANYLLTGTDIDLRTFKYDLYYANTVSLANRALFWTLLKGLDLTVAAGPPGWTQAVHAAYIVLFRFYSSTFASSTYVRYLYNPELSFWDAVLAIRPRDFNPLVAPESAHEGPELTETQVAALRKIFDAYRDQDEAALAAYTRAVLGRPDTSP
jgi:hypothetical protein